jgi:lipopolysaccharide exporter
MGYSKLAIKGFSWLTLFRAVSRGVSFVKTLIVARLISPSQFGLFGIAMLVLSFIEVITETGVNVFLVQQKEDIHKYLNTAWIVSIMRGTVIALAMIISSPFIASFFKSPEAEWLIIVASAVPFARGFINPAVVKFQTELNFKKESIYRIVLLLVDIIASIIFLVLNPQTISLIYGILVGVLAEVVLSYFVMKPTPRFELNIGYMKKIMHAGKWVTSSLIFNYGFEQGDNIVIGRMLNPQSLGIYNMAYNFATLPISEISDMLIRVVFPVFVKISEDYERLKKAYIKTIIVTTVLVTPFGILFIVFPRELILLVLGSKWIAAAPVLQVLAVLGVVKAISSPILTILPALKLQKYITITTFIGLIGMFVTIIPLTAMYGIVGAAWSATIGYLVSTPFILYYSLRALYWVKKGKITQ